MLETALRPGALMTLKVHKRAGTTVLTLWGSYFKSEGQLDCVARSGAFTGRCPTPAYWYNLLQFGLEL